ncbi:MFS general substrate transporter [Stereum hirsutum FP-91666 SS1]|uniref:MFS general substrate transporter n=1 Tax=Stereum hirsutum (strain FP-91666) TaxID=721885 RepID=UPI000444A857|nr:MFS general substrate transporter [Stereum hirsutum FP-91666 SS1]EIM82963.1 MFS general substrate transporter [Stereum hirsutum FP-91666 SS1]
MPGSIEKEDESMRETAKVDSPSPGDLYERDGKEERRIFRKMDMHLLPFVSLLYLLSFLDRSNVGNAKIAGMATDLKLVGLRYNIIAAVFFLPYCFVEIPSNILLKLTRPSRWIPSIMLAWGLVMTLMCLVNSYHGLIIARIFLGLAEGGLFPGVTFYISLWYPRRKQAKRIAIFFSAATIAGAFGGILAFGIEKMEGIGGLHGWQWIFCLEGLLTVIIAALAFFFMHDYPETATFLTDSERRHIVALLAEDSKNLAKGYSHKYFWQAIKDYKSWMQIVVYMGVLIPVYAVALFTPSIIAGLGYAAARAQLLSIPPFVCGCLMTIVVGIYSDKLNLRGPFIMGGAFVSLVGYIVCYTTTSPGAGYVGAIIACLGVYPTIAVNLAWAGGNAGGDAKRGVVIAMVIGIGNLGGICSSFIYYDSPRFHHGHGTMMGWLGLTIISTAVLMWRYSVINAEKEALCKREGIDDSREEEFRELGDESPLFRYTI